MSDELKRALSDELIYQSCADLLESKGFSQFHRDRDGFWFEGYLIEYKWKDLFMLMHEYAERQNAIQSATITLLEIEIAGLRKDGEFVQEGK